MTPDSDPFSQPDWHPDRASGLAQLERFLMQIDVPYPNREEERAILLATTGAGSTLPATDGSAASSSSPKPLNPITTANATDAATASPV